MEKWLRDSLSHCLDFDVPDDMVKYVMTLKNSEEFDEYFSSLLNSDYPEHRHFMSECKQRLFSKALPNKKAFNHNPQQSSKIQTNANKKQDKSSAGSTSASTSTTSTGGGKKKPKYVNLFDNNGKLPNTVLLKGRRLCDCQATEHDLINNCLGCGRIVCVQEGSGPCMFCGDMVATNEELEMMKGEKGEQFKKELEKKGGGGEGLKQAIEHRDRLMQYEREGTKRTEVIDDEEDYFEENSVWHSAEDREKFARLKQELHDKRHIKQSEKQIKMDLFGREVFEEPVTEEYQTRIRKEMADAIAKSNAKQWSNQPYDTPEDGLVNPTIDFKPTYVPTGMSYDNVSNKAFVESTRVQDKDAIEMIDMRRCISMHQPYASLLVYGVKKHEGRNWYTSHRGRLWIASTVKVPTKEEIAEVENFYKEHYKGKRLKFPPQYQTSCLLGCVHVDDVLSQEVYRQKFPDGESDSPFVFICKSPKVLPVVFPHSGSHKIYDLDPKIHQAASRALMRDNTSDEPEVEDQYEE